MTTTRKERYRVCFGFTKPIIRFLIDMQVCQGENKKGKSDAINSLI